ncbi:hypothetical protein [Yersinia pseudotuberculosis]|uniref:hypothetical protein n=1 Tax=Yersinia pseudotuberculosis TaxID=633 RepID=UPI0004F663AB|nr:hypothetical protein [Yersinia pseudotuberculosis]AIN14594.1 DNA transfer protein gp16 [Yersinia pseudotuberculosis]AYX15420.1 DNA transfer protein [Yersinia pseudotuberculosis]
MAIAWKDVISKPEYQQLPPDQQAAAQEQYFNEVVAPQAGDQAEAARQQFFTAYPPAAPTHEQPQQSDAPIQQPKEPTILDSVEQAARGLVNIPFDILQGGASLINAGSRAAGAGDVLGPIYRPVDRPTDKYAQAGEAIGGYLVPGLGVAGNMVAGSLAEASNQQGDFAENALKNAAINLGAQGALSGAAKLIGRGVTAFKGNIAPEAKRIIDTAEGMGVTPMTSDMIKPGNALTRGIQQGSEGALLGTGAKRESQQGARSKAVSDYLDKFGEYNPDDIVKSLTSTLRGRKDAAGVIYNDITSRMGNSQVVPTNTINAIDTGIARLDRLGKSADQRMLSVMRNLKDDLTSGNIDFSVLKDQRSAFRTNVQGDSMIFPNQAKATTNMIENAMSKDLRSAVGKTLGPQDAAQYVKANSNYSNVYNKVLNKKISSKLNNATSQATPELINSIVYSRNASDIKRIWPALDEHGKNAMRAAYISKISEKTGGSPAKFLTEVSKLKRQSGGEIYSTIFSGQHINELDALHEVLQRTARADSANVVTQTGQSLANNIRLGSAIGTSGTSIAGEAGFGLVMRAYESRPVRNALLKLANTKAGTPGYERVLNQAAVAVRPLLANQVLQQQQ